jgi:predicted acyltransferase
MRPLLFPPRVFGANPLLAYILCWLLMPLLDSNFLPATHGPVSVRYASQLFLRPLMDESQASFVFGIGYLLLVFAVLCGLHRKGLFLKL